MEKQLIILVGNIGTGKSTLCKSFVKKDFVCITRDGLRYTIGGGDYIFNPHFEPIIWDTELFMFKKFISIGSNIIVDEVGISKKIRARYIKPAKKLKYSIEVIVLPQLSREECVKRRMNNPHDQPDKKLWEKVWDKFNKLYEEPSLDEGIDKITYVSKDYVTKIKEVCDEKEG